MLFYKRLLLNPSNVLIIRSPLHMLDISCTQSVNVIFTGVIDLPGAAGGIVEFKAWLLASYGFATLALAYLGYEDQPSSPSSINLDYFEEAANWLISHSKVLPHGIGMHPICYGSWIALLTASYQIALIKAIVAISYLVIAFLLPFQLKGRVSDMIPLNDSRVVSSEKSSIYRFTQPTDIDYMNPTTVLAITPVENILPCHAGFWNWWLERPYRFYVKVHYWSLEGERKRTFVYPQAGHLIEPPYSPICDSSFKKSTKEWCGYPYLAWGGETVAHARTQEDCWPKILHFLRKHL